jgi:hypothetical protein
VADPITTPPVNVTATRMRAPKAPEGYESVELASPNGKGSFWISVPKGLSDAEIVDIGARLWEEGREKTAREIDSDPISQGAREFPGEISGVKKFGLGVADATTGMLYRGPKQLITGDKSEQRDFVESRKPVADSGAYKAGELTGLAGVAAPLTAVPGINTISGGALAGGLYWLAMPTSREGERSANVVGGAAGGGLFPAAARLYQGAKAAVQPLFEGGRQSIAGRTLRELAGDEADAVTQRLSAGDHELVPGSVPMTAEVAGNAGISTAHRTQKATDPVFNQRETARRAEQNAARVKQLDDMSGDDGLRDMLEAQRAVEAEKGYRAAYKAGVAPKKLTPAVEKRIGKLLENPWVQDALSDAEKLAKGDGLSLADPKSNLQGMHYLKKALDGMSDKKRASVGLGPSEERQINQARTELVAVMRHLSPKYAQAMDDYKTVSRDLNQMNVARALREGSSSALENPQTGVRTIYPAKYGRMVSDVNKLAAQGTGFRKAKFNELMEPEQAQMIDAIKQDLSRAQNLDLGKGSGSDTVQKAATARIMDALGVPEFLRNMPFVEKALDAAYTRPNKGIEQAIADALMDPAQAAKLMQQVTPQTRKLVQSFLLPVGRGLAIGAGANVEQ